MASPKLQIHLTTPTEASITVSGKVLGTIKIQLKELETIDGIDNPIVVIGECISSQNGMKSGFAFQDLKNVITAQSADAKPITEPTEPITTIAKTIAKGA